MAISILLFTSPTSVAADEVNDESELISAIEGADPGIPLIIELKNDIVLSSVTTLIIPAGADITLTGGYSLTGVDGHPTITVDGTLKIDGITVTHKPGESGSGVLNNGTFSMTSGKISGNHALSSFGGGVYNTGTFNMSGSAEISGNTATNAAGVYNLSTFNMSGGTIGGSAAGANVANSDGGGVQNANSNAVFNMTGGEISYNKARGGGGVSNSNLFEMSGGSISYNDAHEAGGVLNYRTFNMSGSAEISNNTAVGYGGGVHNNGSAFASAVFNMSGGTISGNSVKTFGGGVSNAYSKAEFYISGTALITGNTSLEGYGGGVSNIDSCLLSMSGGTISNNHAYYGGGVSSYLNITFEMTGGSIVENNADYYGGGVMNWQSSTFNISGGAVISGNEAAQGGGVANWGNDDSRYSTFTMSGGTISYNKANNGGGIYNNNLAPHVLAINGGTISNNSANFNGGGVWVYYDLLHILNIAAGVTFSDNSAGSMYDIADADKGTYNAHVSCVNWTVPFIQGYNNYDISYTNGTELVPVTFMQNHDGSDSTVLATVIVGKGTAFGANMPSDPLWAGYDFTGWNTSRDGAGTAYTASSVVGGALTLYAQWEAGTPINVTFDKNTSDTSVIGPDPASKTVFFNAPYGDLATITRAGYTFGGWYLDPGCIGGVVASSDLVTETGDHVLYAKWISDSLPVAKTNYIVHYYLYGTTVSVSPDKILTGQTVGAFITENAVTVSGYTALDPVTKSIVLAAHGNEIIFFYKDGHIVTVNDSFADFPGTGTYKPGVIVTIDGGVREGYTFAGWTVVSGGVTLSDPISPVATFTMPADDVVVTANWIAGGSIGGTLSGKSGDGWSLFNLILCAIGGIVAIFSLAYASVRKDKKERKTNRLWLLVAIAAGVAGIILFILTEDMSAPMKYVDYWTIANAIILILGIVGARLAFDREREMNGRS
ncbi:MAG: InlB B-repeat-containing protein [Methanomassiliicoccaceae archaeon]|nr:InlB B-repeat-containing protein [Methanomassiliicoccaceae archaeon]